MTLLIQDIVVTIFTLGAAATLVGRFVTMVRPRGGRGTCGNCTTCAPAAKAPSPSLRP